MFSHSASLHKWKQWKVVNGPNNEHLLSIRWSQVGRSAQTLISEDNKALTTVVIVVVGRTQLVPVSVLENRTPRLLNGT